MAEAREGIVAYRELGFRRGCSQGAFEAIEEGLKWEGACDVGSTLSLAVQSDAFRIVLDGLGEYWLWDADGAFRLDDLAVGITGSISKTSHPHEHCLFLEGVWLALRCFLTESLIRSDRCGVCSPGRGCEAALKDLDYLL